MDLKAKLAVSLMLLASFPGTGATAMTVEDFGRMHEDDESTYVALLIMDAAHILRARGQPEQASQVISYFKVPGKFGGVQELADKVKTLNALNKKNAINPNNRAPVYQIEDAMESVLREKGIKVSAEGPDAKRQGFSPIRTAPPTRFCRLIVSSWRRADQDLPAKIRQRP